MKTKVVIASVCVVAMAATAVWLCAPRVIAHPIDSSIREQGELNRAAKPLFDAVVTKKLYVGQTLKQAQEVLRYAGLRAEPSRYAGHVSIQSIYRASESSGFHVQLEFDAADELSKIDIQEYLTGP